jgi:hypothetical protein
MAEGKYELGKTHRYRQSGPIGSLKIIAAIEVPPVIVKILSYLGLPTRAPPRSPGSDSIYSRQSEEPKTGCQREPTAPLALSSSVRRDLTHFASLRAPRCPNQPKQHRDFHQTEM